MRVCHRHFAEDNCVAAGSARCLSVTATSQEFPIAYHARLRRCLLPGGATELLRTAVACGVSIRVLIVGSISKAIL
ncbi:hypothetical protein E2C01_071218 [Portunus trituberculatus]|uniref:Uncharacterized protein n=1 Tax=Portunus trituberculatus TaxID=210409 RepID=A0A5B7I479_PORTR|nr:hypothetical protein [Portunus trituberculatus]